jgi:hypothetical protein
MAIGKYLLTKLTTNNQWKTKQNRNNTNKYLQIAIRKQQKKTALTTNNQWKTKQK